MYTEEKVYDESTVMEYSSGMTSISLKRSDGLSGIRIDGNHTALLKIDVGKLTQIDLSLLNVRNTENGIDVEIYSQNSTHSITIDYKQMNSWNVSELMLIGLAFDKFDTSFLSELCKIKSIFLSECKINELLMSEIPENLESFAIRNSEIVFKYEDDENTDESVKSDIDLSSFSNISIHDFDLSNNGIKHIDITPLYSCKSLRTLNLSKNDIAYLNISDFLEKRTHIMESYGNHPKLLILINEDTLENSTLIRITSHTTILTSR